MGKAAAPGTCLCLCVLLTRKWTQQHLSLTKRCSTSGKIRKDLALHQYIYGISYRAHKRDCYPAERESTEKELSDHRERCIRSLGSEHWEIDQGAGDRVYPTMHASPAGQFSGMLFSAD